jgi:hypothetical protein
MSEKMTRVGVPGSPGTGLLLRGHLTWQEAAGEYEKHLRQKLAEAQAALAAIEDGSVEVRHQTGIYRVSDVRLVAAP